MAPLNIRFAVYGDVVPKGNHAAFPIARGRCACGGRGGCRKRNCFGGVTVGTVVSDDGGKELEAWEALVRVSAISARNAAGHRLVAKPGGVLVTMVFLVERPKSHFTSRGEFSAEGERHPLPTSRPDWDKVARGVGDGLTSAVVEDDSQFVDAMISKVYAPRAGVLVSVFELADGLHAEWVHDELGLHGVATSATAQPRML